MDVMTTGWAAVEVRPVIENISSKEQKLVYKKIRHISQQSPNYESVQWCEARAILEAIKMAEPNCNLHIHTDSQGTMLKLQSMMYEPYKKNRTKKHKVLTQEILEEAEKINGTVIIEWAKAHEQAVEDDNWIRILKSSGNDMADAEAKHAVEYGITSADERTFCGPWSLINKENGLPIEWGAMPKAVMLYNKTEAPQAVSTIKLRFFRWARTI